MKVNQIVIWGAVIWALVVLGGVLHLLLHEPSPGSWLSGLESFIYFMFWQTGALAIAVVLGVLRLALRRDLTGNARWLGYLPLILSGSFAILMVVLFATA